MMPQSRDTPPPEQWRCDAGAADVAVLTVPPAFRDRRFEIFCRLVVAARGDGATHGMRVEVNGAHEWSRRLPTENPGHTDSLDYRFRRDVPSGQALRIKVKTEARQAVRVDLSIEADEA